MPVPTWISQNLAFSISIPSVFCQGDEQSYLRNAIVIRRREKAWVIRIAFCELDSVIGINGAGRDRPHPRTLGTQ